MTRHQRDQSLSRLTRLARHDGCAASSGGLNPGGRCTSRAKPTRHGGAPRRFRDAPRRQGALPTVARSPQGEDTKGEAASQRLAGWGHTLAGWGHTLEPPPFQEVLLAESPTTAHDVGSAESSRALNCANGGGLGGAAAAQRAPWALLGADAARCKRRARRGDRPRARAVRTRVTTLGSETARTIVPGFRTRGERSSTRSGHCHPFPDDCLCPG